jgi:hypothetical protein
LCITRLRPVMLPIPRRCAGATDSVEHRDGSSDFVGRNDLAGVCDLRRPGDEVDEWPEVVAIGHRTDRDRGVAQCRRVLGDQHCFVSDQLDETGTQHSDHTLIDTLHALRCLARRHQLLAEEIAATQKRMQSRATAANPALMAIKGIGPVVATQLLITAGDNPDRLRSSASFAALCRTAPIPVSSGRTDRHRLSRGGDRQTNTALHHTSKSGSPATRPPTPTQTPTSPKLDTQSHIPSPQTIVAREVFQALTGHCTVPDCSDLRPTQRAKNLTPQQQPNTSESGPPESENSNSDAHQTKNSDPWMMPSRCLATVKLAAWCC